MSLTQKQKDLFKNLEQVIRLLSNCDNVEGTPYLSPQQAVAELSSLLFGLRREQFGKLPQLWSLLAEKGSLQKLAEINGWISHYKTTEAQFRELYPSLHKIRYAEGNEIVSLGDEVSVTALFKKRQGKVVYIPGSCPPNHSIDHDGVMRVQIEASDGTLVDIHVDEESLRIQKSVTLVAKTKG